MTTREKPWRSQKSRQSWQTARNLSTVRLWMMRAFSKERGMSFQPVGMMG